MHGPKIISESASDHNHWGVPIQRYSTALAVTESSGLLPDWRPVDTLVLLNKGRRQCDLGVASSKFKVGGKKFLELQPHRLPTSILNPRPLKHSAVKGVESCL